MAVVKTKKSKHQQQQDDESSLSSHNANECPASKTLSSDKSNNITLRSEPPVRSTSGDTEYTEPGLVRRNFVDPSPHDVLLRRGPCPLQNPGNERFHEHIATTVLPLLYQATTPAAELAIAEKLVGTVGEWGGRFLDLDQSAQRWYEVSVRKAVQKCNTTLRHKKLAAMAETPSQTWGVVPQVTDFVLDPPAASPELPPFEASAYQDNQLGLEITSEDSLQARQHDRRSPAQARQQNEKIPDTQHTVDRCGIGSWEEETTSMSEPKEPSPSPAMICKKEKDDETVAPPPPQSSAPPQTAGAAAAAAKPPPPPSFALPAKPTKDDNLSRALSVGGLFQSNASTSQLFESTGSTAGILKSELFRSSVSVELPPLSVEKEVGENPPSANTADLATKTESTSEKTGHGETSATTEPVSTETTTEPVVASAVDNGGQPAAAEASPKALPPPPPPPPASPSTSSDVKRATAFMGELTRSQDSLVQKIVQGIQIPRPSPKPSNANGIFTSSDWQLGEHRDVNVQEVFQTSTEEKLPVAAAAPAAADTSHKTSPPPQQEQGQSSSAQVSGATTTSDPPTGASADTNTTLEAKPKRDWNAMMMQQLQSANVTTSATTTAVSNNKTKLAGASEADAALLAMAAAAFANADRLGVDKTVTEKSKEEPPAASSTLLYSLPVPEIKTPTTSVAATAIAAAVVPPPATTTISVHPGGPPPAVPKPVGEGSKKGKKRKPGAVGGSEVAAGQPSDAKQPFSYVTQTENDVLLGRGGRTNNHAGNRRYLEAKDNMQARYMAADKNAKTPISQELVDLVHGWGGRFLKLDGNANQWYEIDNNTARKKCSQSLREINTPEERAAKRARYSKS